MKIRIGTQGSRLEIAQARTVAQRISEFYPDIETEILYIGNREQAFIERSFEKDGGGNIFTDRMAEALLNGEIDLAVHTAKHLPLRLAAGTCVNAVLERSSPRDMFVSRRDRTLPEKPKIGTNSVRRAAGIKKLHPNAEISAIEGSAGARLRALYDGDYDGIVLSESGLRRTGEINDPRVGFAAISWQVIVPSACQGIIAVQSREGENPHIIGAINDEDTYRCFETERRAAEMLFSKDDVNAAGASAYISNGIITLTVTRDQNRIITDSAPVTLRFALAERLADMV